MIDRSQNQFILFHNENALHESHLAPKITPKISLDHLHFDSTETSFTIILKQS